MSRKLLAVVGVSLSLALAGCKSMSPVQKWGLVGAGAGAATGGLWAANAGILNAGEGALVGAAAGGAAGAFGGDIYARRKTEKDKDALQGDLENLRNQNEEKSKRIEELEGQIKDLQDQLEKERQKPKAEEVSQAPATETQPAAGDEEVRDLQEAMGSEAEVGRSDKGITLTFVSEVLYASGKASLTKTGEQALHKAAQLIRERYPNNEISIEGHTDNEPIKYSGYRSNWELSCDRALSVLHYLIEQENFRPELLSATGYADTRPVAPNDTALGRRLNRRAVIVILPDIKYEKKHLSM